MSGVAPVVAQHLVENRVPETGGGDPLDPDAPLAHAGSVDPEHDRTCHQEQGSQHRDR